MAQIEDIIVILQNIYGSKDNIWYHQKFANRFKTKIRINSEI